MTAKEKSARRHRLFTESMPRLSQIVRQALSAGLSPEDIVAVVIDGDDPLFEPLAVRMVGQEAVDAARASGAEAVVHGISSPDLLDSVAEAEPKFAPAIRAELPPGMVRCLVMAEGGIGVLHFYPVDLSDNTGN